MKKIVILSILCLSVFCAHHTAAAGEVLQSSTQARLAAQLFEANMEREQEEQALWDSCNTFRQVWESSFFDAGADLETTFSYFARASREEILNHPEAFSLVYSIASRYRHNNCVAVPGTFDLLSRGEKLIRNASTHH